MRFSYFMTELIKNHKLEIDSKFILFEQIADYSKLKGFNKLMDLTLQDIELTFLNGWYYIKALDFFSFVGDDKGVYSIEYVSLIMAGSGTWINLQIDSENYLSLPFIDALIKFKSSFNYENKEEKIDFSKKTYLMKDSNTGYTKIGKSKNPKIREKTLQSEKPTIIMFAICEKNIENVLHKDFENKRVRGEWFDLSDNDILDLINDFDFKQVNILADSLNFTKSINK